MQDFYQLADARILSMPGAGAGGGMAAGLVAFAGGQISSGIEKSLDLIDFDHKVQKADLVVVGEGRMDLNLCLEKLLSGSQTNTREDPSACYLW